MDAGELVMTFLYATVGKWQDNETHAEFTHRKIDAAEKIIEMLGGFPENQLSQEVKALLQVEILNWKWSLK
jgi:hypothetical protein